jgi:hypothetical protein
MTEREIETFTAFFADYVRSFYSADPEDQSNISLKEEHSFKVCGIARRLAIDEEQTRDRTLIAETIGLFHDIGRFPQYARYRTFRDSVSVNHGALGADVLTEQDLLHPLSRDEQRIVLNAVRFHNAFAVPLLPDADDIFFLRLVRDADKLDIWRIFLGFFEDGRREMTPAVGLGLPETPGYTKEAIACIMDGKPVAHTALKNVNDFTLMQLSWVYDLNFSSSYRMLAENDYINRLIALLPGTPEIREAGSRLREHAALLSPAGRSAGRKGTGG